MFGGRKESYCDLGLQLFPWNTGWVCAEAAFVGNAILLWEKMFSVVMLSAPL